MTDTETEAMELWRAANEAYFSAHHHPVRAPINSRADQAAAAIIATKLAEYQARIERLRERVSSLRNALLHISENSDERFARGHADDALDDDNKALEADNG